jgi:chitodextrinase
MDTGKATTTGTTITISQLIPGTSYLFRISAVTQKGRGAEMNIVSQTERAQSDNGNPDSSYGDHPY